MAPARLTPPKDAHMGPRALGRADLSAPGAIHRVD